MESVPRYPLVKPRRASAMIVTVSLRINDGSCRSGTVMFDNRNIGKKTSRSTDSNTSSMRLDFLGYTRTDKHNTHTQPFYGSVEFVRENPGEPIPEENKHKHCQIHVPQNK